MIKNTEEARAEWAKALNSGEFKQSKDRLCSFTGYCCLGVACEIFRRIEGDHLLPKTDCGLHCQYGVYGDRSTDWLPLIVKRWLGLFNNIGSFKDGSLMQMNDEGKSFAEIAKIIANPPEGLLAKMGASEDSGT